jgi:hypothetical protein
MNRRQLLLALAAAGASAALPRLALAAEANRQAVIGAAWRGPNPNDPYFAGALVADWEARRLSTSATPSRCRPARTACWPKPMAACWWWASRPGTWLLRCDGKPAKLVPPVASSTTNGATARLGGHAVVCGRGRRCSTPPKPTCATGQRHGSACASGSTLTPAGGMGRPTASTRTSCCSTHEGHRDRRQRRRAAHGRADKKFDLHRMELLAGAARRRPAASCCASGASTTGA